MVSSNLIYCRAAIDWSTTQREVQYNITMITTLLVIFARQGEYPGSSCNSPSVRVCVGLGFGRVDDIFNLPNYFR